MKPSKPTFDIAEAGSGHSFAELDQRPLGLAAGQNVAVVGGSDDAMCSHGWCFAALTHRQRLIWPGEQREGFRELTSDSTLPEQPSSSTPPAS